MVLIYGTMLPDANKNRRNIIAICYYAPMPIAPDSTTSLGDLVADGGWVIQNCDNPKCGRRVASRLPAFIAKHGPRANSNVVRANAVCAACGTRGCTITLPSWEGASRGWQEFPGEGVEISPSRLTKEP